ncbi:unnamed protein product [Prunus armeniaca]|uniref:Uncharacterized protein n=1 Tax=Prunus armeniaca TaxID=36596 RepID=A0A6J5VMR9_PRUAR|nr:unnamed protein product [Prunus armeniaca]
MLVLLLVTCSSGLRGSFLLFDMIGGGGGSSRHAAIAAGHGGAEPRRQLPVVKAGALTLFAVLGYSSGGDLQYPFALASIFSSTSGAGQGLSLGVLNLAMSYHRRNLPAFIAGAVAAVASGVLALSMFHLRR